MQIDRVVFEALKGAAAAYLVSARTAPTEFEVAYRGTPAVSRQAFVDALRYFNTVSSSRIVEHRNTDVSLEVGVGGGGVAYRVSFDSPHHTVTSVDDVSRLQGVAMLQKQRAHHAVDVHEYGLRVNVKTEKPVEAGALGIRSVVAKAVAATDSPKTVRDKTRFSVPSKDGTFRYDFTTVRQAVVHDLRQVDEALAGSDLMYEIEVEHVGVTTNEGQGQGQEVVMNTAGSKGKADVDVDAKDPANARASARGRARARARAAHTEANTTGTATSRAKGKGKGKVVEGGDDHDGTSGTDTSAVQAVQLVKGALGACSVLLKVLKDVDYLLPSSAAAAVLQEYSELVGTDTFIGPKPVTLMKADVPSLLKQYTVTEKADGERRMLFVDKEKRVYTMDDRGATPGVAFTGLVSKGPPSTLLDGEFVPARAMRGRDRSLFTCFDAYFVCGHDIRHLPLSLPTPPTTPDTYKDAAARKQHQHQNAEGQTPTRLAACRRVVDAGVTGRNDRTDCELRTKTFFPVESERDLSTGASTIFNQRDAGMYPYEIDGLIFTPATLAVGASVEGEPARKRGGRWDKTFKCKPPHMNTIDFLVRFHDVDMVVFPEEGAFRVVDLLVGHNVTDELSPLTVLSTRHDNNNRNRDIWSRTDSSTNRGGGGGKYAPVLFRPPGETRAVHQALLRMDEDGRVMLEDGDEVSDKTIVEFKFERCDVGGADVRRCWAPLRVRHDKTQRVHEAKTAAELASAANNSSVANANWASIHDPITESMLTGDVEDKKEKDGTPATTTDEKSTSSSPAVLQKYYVRQAADVGGVRERQASFPMRQFHNGWVKSRTLMEPFSGRVRSIFDIGCGKGGDIPKWLSMRGLERVLGIDLYRDGIVDPVDGAYARLMQRHPKNTHPVVVFLPVDASHKIDDSYVTGMLHPGDRHVARVVWGLEPRHKIKDARLSRLHGMGREPFDLVSCQFAVHYFFDNTAALRAFASNVSAALRPGGYFVGTCLDGGEVDARLGSLASGDRIQGSGPVDLKGGGGGGGSRVMWQIRKMYEGGLSSREVDDRTGLRVDVFMESIGQVIPEFLVDFTLLNKTLAEVGIVPAPADAQAALGIPGSSGSFRDLFLDMQQYASSSEKVTDRRVWDALRMTDAHKEYSFMNRWFVYQKKK